MKDITRDDFIKIVECAYCSLNTVSENYNFKRLIKHINNTRNNTLEVPYVLSEIIQFILDYRNGKIEECKSSKYWCNQFAKSVKY